MDWARPLVRCVLIRTGAFSLAASSLLALLPILARPHGPTGYGLLLGSFGFGALGRGGGASTSAQSPFGGWRGCGRDRSICSNDIRGWTRSNIQLAYVWYCSQAELHGLEFWLALNVAAQTMSPPWLRARALSLYLLVLQGGMAIGSAAWGALATKVGIPWTLLCSSLALIAGLFTVKHYRLSESEIGLFAP